MDLLPLSVVTVPSELVANRSSSEKDLQVWIVPVGADGQIQYSTLQEHMVELKATSGLQYLFVTLKPGERLVARPGPGGMLALRVSEK